MSWFEPGTFWMFYYQPRRIQGHHHQLLPVVYSIGGPCEVIQWESNVESLHFRNNFLDSAWHLTLQSCFLSPSRMYHQTCFGQCQRLTTLKLYAGQQRGGNLLSWATGHENLWHSLNNRDETDWYFSSVDFGRSMKNKGQRSQLGCPPTWCCTDNPTMQQRSPASMFKPAAGKFCLSRAWPHPPIPIQGNCFHFIPGVQRAASNRPKNWFFFIIISQPLKFHKNNHRGKCLIKNSNTKGWSLNYNHCHYKHALYYMLLLQLFRFLSRLVNGALKIST